MGDTNLVKELNDRTIRIEELLKGSVNETNLKIAALEKNLEEKIKVANNRILDLERLVNFLTKAVVGSVVSAIMALLIK